MMDLTKTRRPTALPPINQNPSWSLFGQQFLDIAVARGEAEIKPHRVLDDLGREAMAAIRKLSHGLC